MSIEIMARVWKECPQKNEALIVMLALADWCNGDGECFPSVASVAEKARITERAAYRIINRLEAVGEIEIDAGRGRGNASRYRLPGYVARPEPRSGSARKPEPASGIADTENLTLVQENLTLAPGKPDPDDTENLTLVQENLTLATRIKEEPSKEPSIKEPSKEPSKTHGDANGASPGLGSWSDFYAAVSDALGGARVLKAGSSRPLAWVGDLARLAGQHSDNDVDTALRLWWRFAKSPAWRFSPAQGPGLVAAFGKWVGDGSTAGSSPNGQSPPGNANRGPATVFHGVRL